MKSISTPTPIHSHHVHFTFLTNLILRSKHRKLSTFHTYPLESFMTLSIQAIIMTSHLLLHQTTPTNRQETAYMPLRSHIHHRSRIYAIGDFIFYLIVSFSLYYHWRYSLGLYDSTNRQRQSPRTLWLLYDYVTLFRCIHMTFLDPSTPYVRLY